MHYYKFDIANWDQATYHLLPEELGIYLKLINRYYDTEKPLPEDMRPVLRKLQLLAFEATVEQILDEFFVLTDKGWINKKCSGIIKKYHKNSKINKENGRKGGRPRKTNSSSETGKKPDGLSSGYDSVSEKKGNYELLTTNYKLETNKGKGRFAPPSQAEVSQYWAEKKLNGNSFEFYDHFESNGWKVSGKAPMKDWKASARNWSRREEKYHEKDQRTNESSHARVMRRLSEKITSNG